MTEEKKIQDGMSAREIALIQALSQERLQRNEKLEYESFDGYELPPRTQFSMLKKPAVSIKYGKMTFNMACIRLFEGIQYVLTPANPTKKRLAVIPCKEEEAGSVEWARMKKGDTWVNKDITSVDFIENLFSVMGWKRECRYKILGRIVNSDKGLILVFDLEEAIMFTPNKESYIDPATGEEKKRQVKYYPDAYKNRIGRSYNDYAQCRQMTLFEDFTGYQGETQEPVVEQVIQSTASEQEDISKETPDTQQVSFVMSEQGIPPTDQRKQWEGED